MRRKARVVAAMAVMLGLLALPVSAAGGPGASASADTLIAYGPQKKLKIGKRITFGVTCAVNCNARAIAVVSGPGKDPRIVVSGALPAATSVPVILKPNGPLLKGFKAFPGRFIIKTRVSATDPVTGEADVDTRNFRLKR